MSDKATKQECRQVCSMKLSMKPPDETDCWNARCRVSLLAVAPDTVTPIGIAHKNIP